MSSPSNFEIAVIVLVVVNMILMLCLEYRENYNNKLPARLTQTKIAQTKTKIAQAKIAPTKNMTKSPLSNKKI